MSELVLPRDRDSSDIGILKFVLRALFNHDCDELADRLIERFGSFVGLFDATAEELAAVSGMTERAAAFFAFIRPAFRQALLRNGQVKPDGGAALTRYAIAYFMNKTSACDECVFLDDGYNVIRSQRLTGNDPARDIVGYA